MRLPPPAWFALLLLSPAVVIRLPAQTGSSAAIRGTVVHEATGNFVEGAVVTIAGQSRAEITDSRGLFYFGGLAAGTWRLTARSAGSSPGEATVEVAAGRTATVTLRLGSEVVAMERLMVTAQAEGQAQALNVQRNAENIRKVVSQDALANSRLGEVGEVLMALPGLYLEISTHQPSRPVIRGLGSEFNSITFDGVRIGNTNNDRADGVSGYPAESLARVELMKSVTPDMEGDAIGGSINLVSRRAFDLSERLLKLNLGGAYNRQQRNWDQQFNLEYADRFGPAGRLGLYSSLNHYRSDRGYHTSSISYQVDAADNFNISTYTLQDRIEDDSWKLKYTGSLDYKLSETTTLWLRGLYSNDTRYLEDYRTIYRPGTRTAITPDSASSRNGRVDTDRQYREPVSTSGQLAAGLESRQERWTLDARVTYGRATNHYEETFTPVFSFNGTDLSYDRRVREFPVFRVDNGISLADASRLAHRSIARTQHPSRDQEFTFDANARRTLDGLPFAAYLKAGTRVKLRSWVFGGDDELGNWTYTGPRTPAELSEVYVNDRFFRQSGGRAGLAGVYPKMSSFLEAFWTRRGEFRRDDNASAILIESNRRATTEDIAAGYLMGGATLGHLNVVTGARLERTAFAGKARQLETPRGVLTASRVTENSARYTNLLPGLHLNYGATTALVLRFSAHQSVARPSPTDMLPSRRIDDEARTISEGNPNLRVTEADNLDLSAEYYLRPLGVISASLFRKQIRGFYFSTASTVAGGEYDGYRLTRTEMGQGGTVEGLELDWQQRMTFLPGALSGLGAGANATWIESAGRYPNRPGADLTFRGTARRTGNVNLSYVRQGLDLRLFQNFRGDYLSGVGARPALDVYEQSRATLDFSAKYRFSRWTSAYFNAKNLTDAPKITYQGNPSNPTGVRHYDLSFNFGVTREF